MSEPTPPTEATTSEAATTLPASTEPLTNEDIEKLVQERFPSVSADIQYGELTLFVSPEDLRDVLTFARDDERLACHLLADLAGVHWPGGDAVIERQPSTTGWPEYRVARDRGVIEISYVLRSLVHNHWFRVTVGTSDEEPRLPSVVDLFPTANFMEREAFDFFGVEFDGHPNLTRILMPDDWLGHPHRKDYPLGGVEIPYKNDKFIPPPNRRDLREIVR